MGIMTGAAACEFFVSQRINNTICYRMIMNLVLDLYVTVKAKCDRIFWQQSRVVGTMHNMAALAISGTADTQNLVMGAGQV